MHTRALDGTMALIIQCQRLISILEAESALLTEGDDHIWLVLPELMLMVLWAPYAHISHLLIYCVTFKCKAIVVPIRGDMKISDRSGVDDQSFFGGHAHHHAGWSSNSYKQSNDSVRE